MGRLMCICCKAQCGRYILQHLEHYYHVDKISIVPCMHLYTQGNLDSIFLHIVKLTVKQFGYFNQMQYGGASTLKKVLLVNKAIKVQSVYSLHQSYAIGIFDEMH